MNNQEYRLRRGGKEPMIVPFPDGSLVTVSYSVASDAFHIRYDAEREKQRIDPTYLRKPYYLEHRETGKEGNWARLETSYEVDDELEMEQRYGGLNEDGCHYLHPGWI